MLSISCKLCGGIVIVKRKKRTTTNNENGRQIYTYKADATDDLDPFEKYMDCNMLDLAST